MINNCKRYLRRFSALLVLVLFLGNTITAYAATSVSLDVSTQTVYRCSEADSIIASCEKNFSDAVVQYNGMYYKIVGKVTEIGSDNKSVTITSINSSNTKTIECSAAKSISSIASLKKGDTVAVYGKVSINSKSTGTITMTIDYIEANVSDSVDDSIYVLVKDNLKDAVSIDAGTMISRSIDGVFNYSIPASWAETESSLPNAKGYQYELSRIGNSKGTEFLFLFYIDDSYMSNKGDITKTGEVRKAIVRNIMGENVTILSKLIPYLARDYDSTDLKTDYATFGSYSGNYFDANNKRYYAEFMFLPDDGKSADDKAVRVLLYVYTEDSHSDEILLMMRQMSMK